MDSPADPSVSGTASRSHNTTAAGSSREPSQTGEREALLAFHFPPSFLPLPTSPNQVCYPAVLSHYSFTFVSFSILKISHSTTETCLSILIQKRQTGDEKGNLYVLRSLK